MSVLNQHADVWKRASRICHRMIQLIVLSFILTLSKRMFPTIEFTITDPNANSPILAFPMNTLTNRVCAACQVTSVLSQWFRAVSYVVFSVSTRNIPQILFVGWFFSLLRSSSSDHSSPFRFLFFANLVDSENVLTREKAIITRLSFKVFAYWILQT